MLPEGIRRYIHNLGVCPEPIDDKLNLREANARRYTRPYTRIEAPICQTDNLSELGWRSSEKDANLGPSPRDRR